MTGGIVCAGNWIVDIVHVIDRWPDKSELVTISREVEGLPNSETRIEILKFLDLFRCCRSWWFP